MPDNPERYRQLIQEAIGIFQAPVREHITNVLDQSEGVNWYERFLEGQIQRPNLPDYIRRRYQGRLDDVRNGQHEPARDLELGEFQWIVAAYAQPFGLTLKTVVDELHRLRVVSNDARNKPNSLSQEVVSATIRDCRAVLTAIDAQGALGKIKDLPAANMPISPDSQSGNVSDSPHAMIGTLPDGDDADVVMTKVLNEYRDVMRRYISEVLTVAFGLSWIQKVADEAGSSRAQMQEEIDKGSLPHEIIDVGNFEPIIRKFAGHFPAPVKSSESRRRMVLINSAGRRKWAHAKGKLYPIEVEEAARLSVEVLMSCGTPYAKNAADQITRYFRGGTSARSDDAERRRVQAKWEQLELDDLGDDWPQVRTWFDEDPSRKERYATRYAVLPAANEEITGSADLADDLAAQRGAQSKVESPEQAGGSAPLPAGLEADPERRQGRPDEPSRLEAVAATEQLGDEQRTLAGVGEDGWSSAATQRGPSGGGGGPGMVTLEGAGDEDRSLVVNGEGDQSASLLRRWGWLLLLIPLLVAAIAVIAFVAGRAPSGTGPAPAIESIDCLPASPAVGDTVSCTATLSGGAPDSRSWSGGHEPPTGEGERFTTTVRSSGDLTITLTVANAASDDDGSLTLSVPPLPPKIDSIDCSPPSPTLGDTVRCTAELSGGAPDSRSWSGGHEPPTGEGERFTTTVRSPGDLTITLTVANAAGDDDDALTLSVLPPAPRIDSIDCSPTSLGVGDTVSCTAELGGGEPASRSWSGGHDPPTGSGERFTTTVRSPGDLTITLTVANAADEDDDTLTLSVLPLPPKIESMDCSPASPVPGGTVSCTAELSGGEPELRSWTANGDPLTETSPRFVTTTARASGALTITLTVKNDGGGDSETVEMQVLPPPPPRVGPPVIERIDCSPASPVRGGTVSCTAELSGGEPESWSWSGGHDPPTGSDERFTTVVRSSDDLTIGLTVENAGGRDSASRTLEVQGCFENAEGKNECGESPGTDDGAPPEEICAEDADGNPNCGAAGTEADSMGDEDDLEDGEWDEEPITEGDPGLMGDGEWDEEPIMEGDPGLMGDDGAMGDDREDTPSVDANDSEGGAMSDDSVILVPVEEPTSAVVIAEAADDSIDELGVMDNGGLSAE